MRQFVILKTHDGIFALNGAARSQPAWKDISESYVWRDNPAIKIPGAHVKVRLDAILDRGVALCSL